MQKKLWMTFWVACLMMITVTLPVKAATLKSIKCGKTYTSYDVTRDGKKDKIKAVRTKTYAKNGESAIKVYINGKHRFTATGLKGADLSVYTSGSRSILINRMIYGDGGRSYIAYEYRSGKFKSKQIEPSSTFYSSAKVSDGKLRIIGEPKFAGWFMSFSNFTGSLPFKFVKSYTISNGLLKETWRYDSIGGTKTFYAKSTFKTGNKYYTVSKKDGITVSKGSKVTVTAHYYNPSDYTDYFKISVNGKSGWFADSSSIQFRK